jgi:tRNA-modifying protein YgfZ
VVPIRGDAPLTTGADITAGAAVIGTVGSVAGAEALAMLRLDRAAEARSKGEPLRAGGIPIALRTATWGVFDQAPTAAEVP